MRTASRARAVPRTNSAPAARRRGASRRRRSGNFEVVTVGLHAADLARNGNLLNQQYSFTAGPPAATVLSGGYVTPTSGAPDTSFSYRVKYWDTYNRAPDQIWCAIWWGSRHQAFWYPMIAFDSSDTNFVDGKWYTLRMRWLDSNFHAYRFAAMVNGQWAYWPSPTGTYVSGPTVAVPQP
jgi:hypothetical protein